MPVVPLSEPALPAASDQVTDRSAVTVSGVATFATGVAGVRTGALLLEEPVPVPLRTTDCGELEALSVMLTDAVSAATVEGVKVAVRVQVAPAFRVAPQLLD